MEPDEPKPHHRWPLDDVWGDEASELDAEAVVEEIEASEPELAKRWHHHPTIVPFKAVARFIRKSGKRIAVTIAGFTVTIVGLLLVPLPGPGWAIVFGGLAILATEYVWARRLLLFAKSTVDKTIEAGKRNQRALRASIVVFCIAAVLLTWAFLFAWFRVGAAAGVPEERTVPRAQLPAVVTSTFGPRWPGSAVVVIPDEEDGTLLVKRTWLWLREASFVATPVGTGFRVHSGEIGYGLAKLAEWAVVVIPLALIPSLPVYVVMARRAKRREAAPTAPEA